MNEQQEKAAVKILSLLERQRFADWYNQGHFDAYLSSGSISKRQILEEIVNLFDIGDTGEIR